MGTFFKDSSWNVICDLCGRKLKAGQLRKDWRGLMVCEKDFEYRNPQDFIRVPPEKIVPPWVRPEPVDQFIQIPYVCMLETSNAIAGVGVAGCAVVGSTYPPFIPGMSAVAGRAIAGKAITGRN